MSEFALDDALELENPDGDAEARRRDYELYCSVILGCEPEADEGPFARPTPEVEEEEVAIIERELERRPVPSHRLPFVVRRLFVRPLTRARGRRARRATLRRSPAHSRGREPDPEPPKPLALEAAA
jgi:hypothetical protein